MKIILTSLTVVLAALIARAEIPPAAKNKEALRVLVWSEGTEPQNVYPDGIRGAVAGIFADRKDVVVKTATLTDPEQGLSEETLEKTDVLVWWGHVKHGEVKGTAVKRILRHIKEDGMGFIALHSAHWSKPFIAAMNDRAITDALETIPQDQRETIRIKKIAPPPGLPNKLNSPLTPSSERVKNDDGTETLVVKLPSCVFPAVRADGKPSHVTILMPDHPIVKGVPVTFDIPQTEMYGEPFHVPKPDAVILEEKWDLGEHFPSGCIWKIGKGKVFYFRPGHETYPIFFDPNVRKILANAVVWSAPRP